MPNDELLKYGFELCTMDGQCDSCDKEIKQGEYFWKRTSYEYVEGDYWCRECATEEVKRTSATIDDDWF